MIELKRSLNFQRKGFKTALSFALFNRHNEISEKWNKSKVDKFKDNLLTLNNVDSLHDSL